MPHPLRVLITGATGCVGRHIVDDLLQQTSHGLVLLVRDRLRLPDTVRASARVTVLEGDLRDACVMFAAEIAQADAAVLAAASWGPDPAAQEVNVDATLALIRALTTAACRHVIYFSTASILDHEHAPLPEALRLGTPYVRAKADCVRQLHAMGARLPATILYPTLVFGGGGNAPRSHLSSLLPQLAARRSLLRVVRADGSFHAIHAADIAAIVRQLLPSLPDGQREYVLGGSAVLVNDAIDALCAALDLERLPLLRLSPRLADLLVRFFRVRMEPWDRYCMQRAHFTHRTPVMPEDFGAASAFPTFFSLVASALSVAAPAARP